MFIFRRVLKNDVYDRKKLKRVLSWVKQTIDDKRIIEADSLTYVYTWIDAAYAIHSDKRSHNGGSIYMRHGVLHKKESVGLLTME